MPECKYKNNDKSTKFNSSLYTCPTIVAAKDCILYFPVIKSATFWKIAALCSWGVLSHSFLASIALSIASLITSWNDSDNSEFIQQDSRKKMKAKYCVWQTWQGYYWPVLLWSSLNIKVSCLLQKICLKEGEVWQNIFFK